MHKKIVTAAAVALVVGFGAGYFAHPTTPNRNDSVSRFSSTNGGAVRPYGNSSMGGFLTGTVAKQDAGSMTINTRDGSSHVVFVTPATTVSKSVTGTLGDVATGSTVIVSGTTNSDGSTSATLIQLRSAAETAPAK